MHLYDALFKPGLPSLLYLGMAKEPDKSTLSLGKKSTKARVCVCVCVCARTHAFHLIVGKTWCQACQRDTGGSQCAFLLRHSHLGAPFQALPASSRSSSFPEPWPHQAGAAGAGQPGVAGTEVSSRSLQAGLKGGWVTLRKEEEAKMPGDAQVETESVTGLLPLMAGTSQFWPFPVSSTADSGHSLGSGCRFWTLSL